MPNHLHMALSYTHNKLINGIHLFVSTVLVAMAIVHASSVVYEYYTSNIFSIMV